MMIMNLNMLGSQTIGGKDPWMIMCMVYYNEIYQDKPQLTALQKIKKTFKLNFTIHNLYLYEQFSLPVTATTVRALSMSHSELCFTMVD